MEELKQTLKQVLSDSFLLVFKAQSYHWNVEGILFSQYHDFFGDLYQEVYGSIDKTAEYLRILGEYAPKSISELYEYKTVEEDAAIPDEVQEMLSNLQQHNNKVIDNLNKLFDYADKANEQGIADFAAARLDAHKKHAWMIRSSLKNGG